MFNAFVFWMMKPIAEIAVGFVIVMILMMIYGLTKLPDMLRKIRCKHELIREDRTCTAWCRTCGKNLGFIGNIRKK
jgi:hypothetical protein